MPNQRAVEVADNSKPPSRTPSGGREFPLWMKLRWCELLRPDRKMAKSAASQTKVKRQNITMRYSFRQTITRE
ncbi:Uncharacterised protein [Vibrio cholerae]|nr:Uncharacterised protein [Vibrio cholerae]